MTIQEHERRQRQRRPYHRKSLTKKEREQRKRERADERRQLQSKAFERGHVVVYPLRDWCRMRGVSIATARRLAEAGRVKLTQLSTRRLGVRSDHDLEYLNICLRDGA
jgi:hypothetical protein